MFIDDNNLMFSYRGYDERLYTDTQRERMEQYDKEKHDHDYFYHTKVYSDEFSNHPYLRSEPSGYQQLEYHEVPKHEGLQYVPAPFREKFEI